MILLQYNNLLFSLYENEIEVAVISNSPNFHIISYSLTSLLNKRGTQEVKEQFVNSVQP